MLFTSIVGAGRHAIKLRYRVAFDVSAFDRLEHSRTGRVRAVLQVPEMGMGLRRVAGP